MIDTMISRRKVWQLGVAAAGLGLWPSGRAAAQDAAITFWNPGLFPMVDPIDKAKRPEDFYISQAIARFQDANPGVTVQMETLPDGTDSFTKFRTASVAQNGPDVMGMWSGSYMLGVQDFLEPLNEYFTAEERKRITRLGGDVGGLPGRLRPDLWRSRRLGRHQLLLLQQGASDERRRRSRGELASELR